MQRIERAQLTDITISKLERAKEDYRQSLTTRPLPREVRLEILNIFLCKCAFCERGLDEGIAQFLHYYPKSKYPQLAYEWDNIFISCPECLRNKSDRVPHEEFDLTGWRDIRKGLLNPCIDDPSEHLIFTEDGRVQALTQRGIFTIDILGLNRISLLKQRGQHLESVKNYIEENSIVLNRSDIPKDLSDNILEQLILKVSHFLSESGQFSIFISNIIPELIKVHYKNPLEILEKLGLQEHKNVIHTINPTQEREVYNLQTHQNINNYYLKQRLIERIEISNFKTIESFNVDLINQNDKSAPWLMLLGDNGAGKSSILQAIALTLMGKNNMDLIFPELKAQDFLKIGAKEGYVRIFLSNVTQPIELKYDSSSFLHSNKENQPILLLGYGATRLLPRAEEIPKLDSAVLNIDNLFNRFKPLMNVNITLYQLPDEEFIKVSGIIEGTISVDRRIKIKKAEHENMILVKEDTLPWIPFAQWSDGYQAFISLICDLVLIMKNIWGLQDDFNEAFEGVVLLDELDIHLHPSWKRRIVSDLRRVFPRVQFITTTHDPLCLQGLHKEEIVVLRKNNKGEVFQIMSNPNFEGMEVDQILMSSLFGLHSTTSLEMDNLLSRYYELLGSERSEADETELHLITVELEKSGSMGLNSRERLFYETVDQLVSENETRPLQGFADLSQNIKTRLLEILDEEDFEI